MTKNKKMIVELERTHTSKMSNIPDITSFTDEERLRITEHIERVKTSIHPQQMISQNIMEILDEIKEHITDEKYLQLSNKLMEQHSNIKKSRYYRAKINKKVRDLVRTQYPEIFAEIHNVVMETEENPERINRIYFLTALYRMKENILTLMLNKIFGSEWKKDFEELKKINTDKDDAQVKAFLLVRQNCPCCCFAYIDPIPVIVFMEKTVS